MTVGLISSPAVVARRRLPKGEIWLNISSMLAWSFWIKSDRVRDGREIENRQIGKVAHATFCNIWCTFQFVAFAIGYFRTLSS
jgi:hypothetical protein